jgi:hypothetical protein
MRLRINWGWVETLFFTLRAVSVMGIALFGGLLASSSVAWLWSRIAPVFGFHPMAQSDFTGMFVIVAIGATLATVLWVIANE